MKKGALVDLFTKNYLLNALRCQGFFKMKMPVLLWAWCLPYQGVSHADFHMLPTLSHLFRPRLHLPPRLTLNLCWVKLNKLDMFYIRNARCPLHYISLWSPENARTVASKAPTAQQNPTQIRGRLNIFEESISRSSSTILRFGKNSRIPTVSRSRIFLGNRARESAEETGRPKVLKLIYQQRAVQK